MQGAWWTALDTKLFEVFADGNQERRDLSAALLGALLVGSARGPMWTLPDIRSLLGEVGFENPVSNEELLAALEALIDARHVVRHLDSAAPVGSYVDGVRRREAWSLTRQGRVLVAAVRDAVMRLDRSLQLPARLLDAVEQTLRALVSHHEHDAGMLAPTLGQVRTHLEQLQEAGGDFYSAVGALGQRDVSDDAVFATSRQHILLALQQFARRTDQSLGRVRGALAELNAIGVVAVLARAVPGAGVLDTGAQEVWSAEQARNLADLEAWFAPRGAVERLVEAAGDAIHALLGAIDRRFYAATRGSDVGADFRQFAHLLSAQPTDPDAYQVFAAVFGVWPSQHPLAPAAEDLAVHELTANGAPHEVRVVLKPSERASTGRGRPRKIPDLAGERLEAQEAQHAELVRLEEIARALVTPGRVPLEYFSDADGDRGAVLVDLLEEALGAFEEAEGCGRASMMGAELTLWPGVSGRPADLRLGNGALVLPDLLVQVRLLDNADHQAAT
jgi:uncharacterized protein (TIGR02677 family)